MNWIKAIEWFRKDPRSEKILMIVDCNKDKIIDYNEKTSPLYGSRYLPDGVLLVYCKDSANDTWLNKLLISTDKRCKSIKDQIVKKGVYDSSIPEIRFCNFNLNIINHDMS